MSGFHWTASTSLKQAGQHVKCMNINEAFFLFILESGHRAEKRRGGVGGEREGGEREGGWKGGGEE